VYLIEMEEELRGDEIVRELVMAAENVELLNRTAVRRVLGEQFVTGITVESLDTGKKYDLPVQGVFIEVGLSPNSGLVKDLLTLNEYGEVPVDCAARTVIPGLYAAGDVTAIREKQIIIAAGDGAKAALGAYSYIVRLPKSTVTDWARPIV
jgi:alkyl hydroperoxide reductase subunit F